MMSHPGTLVWLLCDYLVPDPVWACRQRVPCVLGACFVLRKTGAAALPVPSGRLLSFSNAVGCRRLPQMKAEEAEKLYLGDELHEASLARGLAPPSKA